MGPDPLTLPAYVCVLLVLLLLLLLLPFYGFLDFVRDKLGEPVPEETFSHSHLSWSSIIPYLLPASIMIHGILPVQFACLTVFFRNLSKFSLVYLLACKL